MGSTLILMKCFKITTIEMLTPYTVIVFDDDNKVLLSFSLVVYLCKVIKSKLILPPIDKTIPNINCGYS